jgi:hypothetical protein
MLLTDPVLPQSKRGDGMASPFVTISCSNGTVSVDLSLIVTATVGNSAVTFGDNENFASGGKTYQLPATATQITVDIKEAVGIRDWSQVYKNTWPNIADWTGSNMSFSTSGPVRAVTAHGPSFSD